MRLFFREPRYRSIGAYEIRLKTEENNGNGFVTHLTKGAMD